MPLPRYQPPAKKRPKVEQPSLDNLDDYCLSKIIGHTLALSSLRDNESTIGDNGRTERNLSLVSKRWYFLTQTQVGIYGVHRINLDKLPSLARRQHHQQAQHKITGSNIATYAPFATARKPGVLMQRNTATNSSSNSYDSHRQEQTIRPPANDSYNIDLFRCIRPKLLKYKHIHIEGSLACGDFKKLVVALDAARVEELNLKIHIDRDKTLGKEFAAIPKQMSYLEKLSLQWNSGEGNDFTNALTWTIFVRANKLKTLELNLDDGEVQSIVAQNIDYNLNKVGDEHVSSTLERIAGKFLDNPMSFATSYNCLQRVVFNRSSAEPPLNCGYTSLIRGVLLREANIDEVITNDSMLIEHLIRSSDRICTRHELRALKFLTPIRNLNLLDQLLKSKSLATNQLSIVADNIDQLEDVRQSMEYFRLNRISDATCQLSVHLKDQKFTDCEDKIKNLIQLSRLAELTIYMSSQQRVSIDCCHLMWSVGRALQASNPPGRCLFRIGLQPAPGIRGSAGNSEITVPFGSSQRYTINQNREDLVRHREIMKALKKDSYHQFVKSIRDNITP